MFKMLDLLMTSKELIFTNIITKMGILKITLWSVWDRYNSQLPNNIRIVSSNLLNGCVKCVFTNRATTVLQPCYNRATTVYQPCYNRATTVYQPCVKHALCVKYTCQPCVYTVVRCFKLPKLV